MGPNDPIVTMKVIPQHLQLYHDLATLLINQIVNNIHITMSPGDPPRISPVSSRDTLSEINRCKELIAGAIEWHAIDGPQPRRDRLVWLTDGNTVWIDRAPLIFMLVHHVVKAWAYVDTPPVPASLPRLKKQD